MAPEEAVSVTDKVMVAACGTPGAGDGKGNTGVIVRVPVPSAAIELMLRLVVVLGTKFAFEIQPSPKVC